jgi:hypothetical protein
VLVPAVAYYTYLDVNRSEKFWLTTGMPVEAASMVPCVFPYSVSNDLIRVARCEIEMYLIIVVLFLLVCPLASAAIEAFRFHENLTSLALIGRWWTFWAVGIRLFTAGIRQVIQPRFTAEQIFGIRDPTVLPIVREIGFANLSVGTLGICSIFREDWVIPAAIVGGLSYGFAGLGHLLQKNKNANEYNAMISDVFASVILAAFVLRPLL